MPQALIGLGSNLGDRAGTLTEGLRQLEAHPAIHVPSCSRFLKTRPVGGPEGQSEFLNAAAILVTTLPPLDLLGVLQQVEQQLGRVRNARWDERTLDLDLLLYEDLIWHSAELTIPHPRLAWRAFALLPAAEISPQWRHPTIGWTLAELLRHLQQAPNYLAISSPCRQSASQLVRDLGTSYSHPHLVAPPRIMPSLLADPSPCKATELAGAPEADLQQQPGLRQLRKQAMELTRAVHDCPHDAEGPWLISDFWLPETLLNYPAEIQPLVPGGRLPAEYEAVLADASQPKLLVCLDDPGETWDESTRLPRTKLLEHYHRGPRLMGHADQGPELLVEVRAALEGM